MRRVRRPHPRSTPTAGGRRARSCGRAVIFALAAATAGGCAGMAERTVRETVPAGIEESLEAAADPDNQELIRRLANDPVLQQAAHDFTEAIVGGALDGLTDEARAQRIRELSDLYLKEIASSAAEALRKELAPAARDAVDTMLAGAVDSARRRQLDAVIANVTRSAVAGFADGAAEGMREALGPAIHDVLVDELGPALGQVIADDLRPAIQEVLTPATNAAVAGLVQEVAHAAVLGANAGLSDLGIAPTPAAQEGGLGLLGWLAIVLGLVVAALVLILVRAFLTRRNLEQERARSERMLLNVLRTIQYTDSDDPRRPPDLDELLARARVGDPDADPGDPYVAHLLARARSPSLIPGPRGEKGRPRPPRGTKGGPGGRDVSPSTH